MVLASDYLGPCPGLISVPTVLTWAREAPTSLCLCHLMRKTGLTAPPSQAVRGSSDPELAVVSGTQETVINYWSVPCTSLTTMFALTTRIPYHQDNARRILFPYPHIVAESSPALNVLSLFKTSTLYFWFCLTLFTTFQIIFFHFFQ